MKARGLPRRWSASLGFVWCVCVVAGGWRYGREEDLVPAFDMFFLMTGVLGLALGVAMAKEGRARWIFLLVLTAAFVATIATVKAYFSLSDQTLEDPIFPLVFPGDVLFFGGPVAVGACIVELRRQTKSGPGHGA
jgi:hypothetical protein